MSPQTLDIIAAVQRAIKDSSIGRKEAPERMPRGQVIGEASVEASTESVSSPDDGVKR